MKSCKHLQRISKKLPLIIQAGASRQGKSFTVQPTEIKEKVTENEQKNI